MNLTWAPLGAVFALLVVIGAGLVGERRMALRRRAMRRLYQFGERVLSSQSFVESLRLLESVLPGLLGVTEVRLYLQDRATRTMQRLEAASGAGVSPMPVLTPEHVRFLEKSVELCYRNRSYIAAPETRRSPLFDASQAAETPRSMAFIPMFSQENLLGVLAIGTARKTRHFSEDERALLQHLANQVAIGVKLLEQMSLRGGTETMARLDAQCQLLTTTAGELRQTLSALADVSQSLARRGPDQSVSSEARRIAGHAGVASGATAWILRFASLHREPQQVIDVAALLRGMLTRREADWRERGLHVNNLVSPDPILVAAPAGILEQLFSSFLWHAEERLAHRDDTSLTVRATRLASSAQVDLSWPASLPEAARPEVLNQQWVPAEDMLSPAVCRELVAALGGQMKLARTSDDGARLEVEFPLAQPELFGTAGLQSSPGRAVAPLTALVLEPDADSRQALVSALSDRGHRAIPIFNASEAADLARRMVFHVIFCSSSITCATWLECLQATRDLIRTFVLLTKVQDPALAAALPSSGAYMLTMPPRPEELDRVLQRAEPRANAGGG